MALIDKLTSIANAIRSKTGSTDLMSLDDMPTAIEGIQSGGGNPSAESKDVNFIDYDGTVLYSYTASEFAELSVLPENPTHSGLTSQGWNWSLSDAKTYVASYGKLCIGQMYITDDGKTRIYIHLEEGRTSPMLGCCPNGTVTVDWGDGTTTDTLTGTSTSTVKWTGNHAYASAGDYVITLTVSGSMGFAGSSTTGCYLLRYSSSSDKLNYGYRNSIRKIEIGKGVTIIGNYAFTECHNLSNITIPNIVTSILRSAFDKCLKLSSITIPNSVTSIGSCAFQGCHNLSNVAIPNSVTKIDSYAFCSVYVIPSITIPNSVTSIGDNMFQYCYILPIIKIPKTVTKIPSGAFYGCYSVAIYDFSTHTAVPTLSATNAFYGIPSDCEIRVPAALYDTWIAATNWSTYASNIVAV